LCRELELEVQAQFLLVVGAAVIAVKRQALQVVRVGVLRVQDAVGHVGARAERKPPLVADAVFNVRPGAQPPRVERVQPACGQRVVEPAVVRDVVRARGIEHVPGQAELAHAHLAEARRLVGVQLTPVGLALDVELHVLDAGVLLGAQRRQQRQRRQHHQDHPDTRHAASFAQFESAGV
jgi:hypothetical protein